MQYQIFVQNSADRRFTASVIGMSGCVAEGATKEEAMASVERLLEEQLAHGEIVTRDLPNISKEQPHAALLGHGMFKDDPTFDDFLEHMAEFRQQVDGQETV
ncbi:MAG: type II toxin-antitoxin system HicB family antitoxin [Alkalinema sp. RU_4_3]|nr:type II toxin-antitoxin system HicB family antitoxin [Alkalinema sp. RU_4_3]